HRPSDDREAQRPRGICGDELRRFPRDGRKLPPASVGYARLRHRQGRLRRRYRQEPAEGGAVIYARRNAGLQPRLRRERLCLLRRDVLTAATLFTLRAPGSRGPFFALRSRFPRPQRGRSEKSTSAMRPITSLRSARASASGRPAIASVPPASPKLTVA